VEKHAASLCRVEEEAKQGTSMMKGGGILLQKVGWQSSS
jgi:hypothetical protein